MHPSDGIIDGSDDGSIDGSEEGSIDGSEEGSIDGSEEGWEEGLQLGVTLGELEDLHVFFPRLLDAVGLLTPYLLPLSSQL